MQFNPQEHLTIIDGGAYLATQWRLVWFREVYPNGTIETTIAHTDDRGVIVRAAVAAVANTGEIGPVATGFGSAPWDNAYPAVETAETKAIGRALAALGFGTQFAGAEFRDSTALADSPVRSAGTADRESDEEPRDDTRPASLEVTERQRKLIDVLRSQLNIGDNEFRAIVRSEVDRELGDLDRRSASALITALQRVKQERQAHVADGAR